MEQRRLLAAYINELMVDPFATSNDVGQFVEIRAEPSARLPEGTYFVAVTERGTNPGVVHTIFDLSNQEVGSNGMLVMLQENSPYRVSTPATPDEPSPAVLRSTSLGFTGLPGGIFQGQGNNVRIDSLVGSNGYFLIQTDVAPQIGDDIDSNNDGLIDPDGIASTWNIFDSISLHHNVFQGPVAYGQIVFVEMLGETRPAVTAAEGVEVIHTPGFGYAARIGDSTGHSAEDWVVGTVRNSGTAEAPDYRLEISSFELPVPPAFAGRRIDHVGESNFVGGVRGTVLEEFEDEDGESALRPFPGLTFLADTNGNGRRDLLTFVAEPDRFENGTTLTNVFPGVTLRNVNADGRSFGSPIQASRQGFNSPNLVFSSGGIRFFYDNSRLRADFYRPVSSVSIDVVASGSSFSPTIGRLEAYNAQGELLGVVRSRPLFGNARQTINVGIAGEQIAYVLAFSDSNPANFAPGETPSTILGGLDRLVFRQFEAVATTDENGEFKMPILQPGEYDIVLKDQSAAVLTDEFEPIPIVIERYENYRLDQILNRNSPPRVEPGFFEIEEHSPVGSLIGQVVATDRDPGQTLSYAIAEPEGLPISIDPETGELFVSDSELLDFETTPVLVFDVSVTDSAGAETRGEMIVNLIDIDEPPIVSLRRYTVFENADVGAPVGRIFAVDPDNPEGPVFFQVIGGSGQGAFAVHESTGVITVADPGQIDFAQDRTLVLVVEVADSTEPPMTTVVEVPIVINDANDPPVILTESMEIAEDAAVGDVVGRVEFEDPDIGQTHIFRFLNNASPFTIDRETGDIRVAAALDFDAAAHFDVTVQVVDDGTPPMGTDRSIRIHVLPVDKPPVLIEDGFEVEENSPQGTPVGRLVAMTREGSEGFEFRSAVLARPFSLFGDKVELNPNTGELFVAAGADIDFETGDVILSDWIVVLADGVEAARHEITLEILDVNEPPVIESTVLGIPRGVPAGHPFAEIQVFDPEGDPITLELLTDAGGGIRLVEGNRLMIVPGSELAENPGMSTQILVRASDIHALATVATIDLIPSEPLRFGAAIPDVAATTGELLNFALPVEYRGDRIRSLRIVTPTGELPPGLRFDPSSGRLTGVPMPQAGTNVRLTIEVVEFDGEVEILRQQQFELGVRRSATPLHNRFIPLDVDGNGRVEPIDALKVLNVIARHDTADALELAESVDVFADTVGDNQVQPLDALRILNHLARQRLPVGDAEMHGGFAASHPADERDGDAADRAIEQLLAEPSLF